MGLLNPLQYSLLQAPAIILIKSFSRRHIVTVRHVSPEYTYHISWLSRNT